jgi:23S rRNA pseudouridine1911/1915/1917 synthase
MAHIGHALVGDDMYGKKSGLINRQALHCGEVSFTHPVTHERITVKAPLPDDMLFVLDDKN